MNKSRTVISIHAENMGETSLEFVSFNASLLFIEEQENQNNGRKTKRHVALLMEFFHFQTIGETQSKLEIPPHGYRVEWLTL